MEEPRRGGTLPVQRASALRGPRAQLREASDPGIRAPRGRWPEDSLARLDGRLRLGRADVEAGLRIAIDQDGRAGLVLAEQEVLGEDVLDHVLNHAAQRP